MTTVIYATLKSTHRSLLENNFQEEPWVAKEVLDQLNSAQAVLLNSGVVQGLNNLRRKHKVVIGLVHEDVAKTVPGAKHILVITLARDAQTEVVGRELVQIPEICSCFEIKRGPQLIH